MKFTPCRKCNGKNGVFDEGYILEAITLENGIKTTILTECDCHKDWVLKNKINTRYLKWGGNNSFIEYNINTDYYRESVDLVPEWVNKYVTYFHSSERTRGAICYWYGENGTQKTSVSYFVLRQLLDEYKCQYILMNRLLKMLIQSERDESIRQEIEHLQTFDLLIIDEAFDLSKLTLYKSGYQIPFLDSFLRERINQRKGIIFISNVKVENIDNAFGVSLKDLINRQVLIDKSRLEFKSKYINSNKIIDDEGLFS